MIKCKEKPCKGTGNAISHGCGKLSTFRKYGLCESCYRNWLLNTPEGKFIIEKTTIRAKKQVSISTKKASNKQTKEIIEKNKSIQRLIQEARIPFHAYIRHRDANLSCISCGSVLSQIWDAGHLYKAELYSGLIFNEDNVNKQCRKCNTYLDGNENGYRKGYENRFGIEKLKLLDSLAIELRNYKYSREELYTIKEDYQKKLKLLK